MNDAVIVGGLRTAFALPDGAYRAVSAPEMLCDLIEGLSSRFDLHSERIGQVVAGTSMRQSREINFVRECIINTSLAPTTVGYSLHEGAVTGLTAAITVSNQIMLGQMQSGIAAGCDVASAVPLSANEHMQQIWLEASRARGLRNRIGALTKLRPSDLRLYTPSVDQQHTGLSLGEHQAVTTALWQVSRQAQDQLALSSHRRLATAWASGFIDNMVLPYRGLESDEALQADISEADLERCDPLYGLSHPPATMTAGNSAPLTDGASAILLASAQWAQERHLPMLARVVDCESAAVDYLHGQDGLLHGALPAISRLLTRANTSIHDFDFWEMYEPFTATTLTQLAALGSTQYCQEFLQLPQPVLSDRSDTGSRPPMDLARINMLGSAIATGRPPAAIGAALVLNAAHLVAARSQRSGNVARALVTASTAGGIGVAMILESVDPQLAADQPARDMAQQTSDETRGEERR